MILSGLTSVLHPGRSTWLKVSNKTKQNKEKKLQKHRFLSQKEWHKSSVSLFAVPKVW